MQKDRHGRPILRLPEGLATQRIGPWLRFLSRRLSRNGPGELPADVREGGPEDTPRRTNSGV
jgi:hypothetical protein